MQNREKQCNFKMQKVKKQSDIKLKLYTMFSKLKIKKNIKK